jgi:hypothetical protein
MTITYTYIEVAEHLLNGGFTGWSVRTMGAICMAESGRNPHAHGLNDKSPESRAYLTEDHGLLQINDYWGPLVLSYDLMKDFIRLEKSFSQLAKDPIWNCRAARQMFELRWFETGEYSKGFTCWSAFNNGSFEKFMPEALIAAKAVGAI